MITVGMNYHVIEGKQQDFEDKFAGVIDALRAAEGHTSSTLWKDVSDSASYLITSEWSDEQAFTDFIRSDAFRAVTNGAKSKSFQVVRSTRFTSSSHDATTHGKLCRRVHRRLFVLCCVVSRTTERVGGMSGDLGPARANH